MATALIPLDTKLLEIRNIVSFSADYIMDAAQLLKDEKQQQIVYTICSNLYRMESNLAQEIKALGSNVNDEYFEPSAFIDSEQSNINISQVIKEFIEKHKTSGELELLRRIL